MRERQGGGRERDDRKGEGERRQGVRRGRSEEE